MSRPQHGVVFLFAAIVLLAGCGGAVQVYDTETTSPMASSRDAATTDGQARSLDPTPTDTADPLGWENGYWYDDPLDVNASDGLSDDELEAYLARTMARVEFIRRHEFTRPVTLDVVTREELRRKVERTGSFASDETLSERRVRIMNGFWEALFFVGEDADAAMVRAGEASAFLGAYYLFGTDTIRVVTDNSRTVRIDERLLAHELVHALQDEYAGTPLTTRSDDDNYATSALIEGDAVFVQRRYAERCRTGTWECVSVSGVAGSGSSDVHRGFRTLRSFAYSDGPAFVSYLYDRGGWEAVDRAFEVRPRTTEEIIHPDRYPSPTPEQPTVRRPRAEWTRLGGPYSVGEVEIFGLFWYQDAEHGTRIVETDFSSPDRGRHDRFTYRSVPSVGWNGDALTIVAAGDRLGYVWVTRWDTERDAEEFHAAYRQVLGVHGGRQIGPRTWEIPEGSYADAFYVAQEGTTVTIVNGPTVDDLDTIYPPLAR